MWPRNEYRDAKDDVSGNGCSSPIPQFVREEDRTDCEEESDKEPPKIEWLPVEKGDGVHQNKQTPGQQHPKGDQEVPPPKKIVTRNRTRHGKQEPQEG